MKPVWKLKKIVFNIECYGEFFSDITPKLTISNRVIGSLNSLIYWHVNVWTSSKRTIMYSSCKFKLQTLFNYHSFQQYSACTLTISGILMNFIVGREKHSVPNNSAFLLRYYYYLTSWHWRVWRPTALCNSLSRLNVSNQNVHIRFISEFQDRQLCVKYCLGWIFQIKTCMYKVIEELSWLW